MIPPGLTTRFISAIISRCVSTLNKWRKFAPNQNRGALRELNNSSTGAAPYVQNAFALERPDKRRNRVHHDRLLITARGTPEPPLVIPRSILEARLSHRVFHDVELASRAVLQAP